MTLVKTRMTAMAMLLAALSGCGAVQRPAPTATAPRLHSTAPLAQTSPQAPAGQLPNAFLGGVIEGYYGPPWSTADTVHIIQFLAQHHMNTFVYAPKDDPYQRASWNVLYPQARLAHLATLVRACRRYHVQFVYSISPGLTITYGSARDRALLLAKIRQIQGLGVHVFMLSLDDIYHGLEGTDWNEYHGDMAWAQSSLSNNLVAAATKYDKQFRLILTPTKYNGMQDNSYWDSLRVHLNRTVPVVWTGPGPGALSAQITGDDVRTVQHFIGHPIVIWDNYPVNDYTYSQSHRPQLFMGPLIGRTPDVVAAVAGYLFNPMIQARASEVALWTGGDYLYRPAAYRPQQSWQAAIRGLGGPAWQALQTFAAASSTYYRDISPPPQLQADMASFWQAPATANLLDTPLYKDWLTLSRVDGQLRSGLPDASLYAELQPWSSLLSRQGALAALAVRMLEDHRQGKSVQGLAQSVQAGLHGLAHDDNIVAANVAGQFVTQALAAVQH